MLRVRGEHLHSTGDIREREPLRQALPVIQLLNHRLAIERVDGVRVLVPQKVELDVTVLLERVDGMKAEERVGVVDRSDFASAREMT